MDNANTDTQIEESEEKNKLKSKKFKKISFRF